MSLLLLLRTSNAPRTLLAGFGAFALSGQPAILTMGRRLSGDFGSFTFAGESATLTYTPIIFNGRTLTFAAYRNNTLTTDAYRSGTLPLPGLIGPK